MYNFGKVEKYFNEATKLNSEYAIVYSGRGNAYNGRGGIVNNALALSFLKHQPPIFTCFLCLQNSPCHKITRRFFNFSIYTSSPLCKFLV